MTREAILKKSNPCGESLKRLSVNEMETIYGASEVSPNITPIISATFRSSKFCISAVGSAIGGIVSYNKDCLG
ncbi:type 2 lantibiotic [Bacillus sp. WMMC1349]|uniref:lichenicidin A2 family type 2 lantibiotic n=1 Tax=Bacillus sp. WMMC1349 TaxID=2736254 RepID=UPI001553BE16|nr:mersacidin family lantibiotic [Bacillus sp. WMMC1349]NPC93163.1 type 2 lantibiotic [Bacillus sp. WMMC1349]